MTEHTPRSIYFAVKFGALLGFAWALMFVGVLASLTNPTTIPNLIRAAGVATAIFVAVFGTILTAPMWIREITRPSGPEEEEEDDSPPE